MTKKLGYLLLSKSGEILKDSYGNAILFSSELELRQGISAVYPVRLSVIKSTRSNYEKKKPTSDV